MDGLERTPPLFTPVRLNQNLSSIIIDGLNLPLDPGDIRPPVLLKDVTGLPNPMLQAEPIKPADPPLR
jgi:hypothetical protein